MKRIIMTGMMKHHGSWMTKWSWKSLRRNGLFYGLILSVLAGIAAGAFGGRNADQEQLQGLDLIFLSNYHVRCTRGMWESFSASFSSAFLFLLMLYLAGLSLWGGFAALLLPFVRGYGYGLAVGYLYASHGFSGVLYNLLMVMPGALLCIFVVAAGAREAFRSSLKLIAVYLPRAVSDDPKLHMKKYHLAMLWLLLLGGLSSVADMLCTWLFSGLFHF